MGFLKPPFSATLGRGTRGPRYSARVHEAHETRRGYTGPVKLGLGIVFPLMIGYGHCERKRKGELSEKNI